MKEISRAALEALVEERLETQGEGRLFRIHHHSASDTNGCNWFLEVVPPSPQEPGYVLAMELWLILRDIQKDLRLRYKLPPKGSE